MIAMKREVAARQMNKLVQVFRGANVKLGNWRQVTVPIKESANKSRISVEFYEDTHGNVYSHRLSYLVYKVRKGGDFFYGKSSNENHIEGV